MLHVRTWQPPPNLAKHVAGVWRLTGQATSAPDWLLPDVTAADLAIQLQSQDRLRRNSGWITLPRQCVVGRLTYGASLRHVGEVDTIGIRLSPSCASLLGVPPSLLRDAILPLSDVAPRLDRELALWAEAFCHRQRGIEHLFEVLASHIRPHDDHLTRLAANELFQSTEVSINTLAGNLGVSRRHLSRRFQTMMGWTPCGFKRLVRFSRACRMATVSSGENWARIAVDAGYFDQAHLVHDFQDFAGQSPTRIFCSDWYASVTF